MSVRKFIFGKVEEQLLEQISKGEYSLEKNYDNVLKIEYNIRFTELASAIIQYYEDDKIKQDIVRVPIVKLAYELGSVSPEIFISAFTSDIIIENPNTTIYRMTAKIQRTLLARFLEITITSK